MGEAASFRRLKIIRQSSCSLCLTLSRLNLLLNGLNCFLNFPGFDRRCFAFDDTFDDNDLGNTPTNAVTPAGYITIINNANVTSYIPYFQ